MTLTHEMAKAAEQQPDGIRLIDPTTSREFVLVRAEVFDRLHELSYDASPWTDDERDALRIESLDEVGWEGMQAYQDAEK